MVFLSIVCALIPPKFDHWTDQQVKSGIEPIRPNTGSRSTSHPLISWAEANEQLINRSSSAVAVAYHPGTVLTSFSKRILGDKAKPSLERGILTPEQAIEYMTKVMSQVKREGDAWGGKYWDWKGDRVQW